MLGRTSQRAAIQLEGDEPTGVKCGVGGEQERGRKEKEKEENFAEGKKKTMKLKWKGQLIGLLKELMKEGVRVCDGRKLGIKLQK